VGNLPIDQQAQIAQLLGMQKQLAEPGFEQRLGMETEARGGLAKDAAARAEEQAERDREFRRSEAERNREHDETSQIRGIQADFEKQSRAIEAALDAAQANGVKITDAQRTASGYAVRAEDASTVIDRVGSDFTGVSSRLAGLVPQGAKSDARQVFDQAKRNFINAVLRRESGAVISDEEFANADLQYFPQPGDDEAVLKQKSENRNASVKALSLAGGAGYDELRKAIPAPSFGSDEFTDGQTATGPNGEKVVYKNGQWVPQ
jgi:hypothetical protein